MSAAPAGAQQADLRVRLFLKSLSAAGWPALHSRSPEQARRDYRVLAAATGTWRPIRTVRDAVVPTPDGDLLVRVYRSGAATGRPLVMWFHGGGFVVGDLFTADSTCRRLAAGAGATVVSVHYRRAPEHPLPAAHDDAMAATLWAIAHAAELGVDRRRIIVAGDSAGGGLAAHIAQRLRDEGPVPAALQVLFYPATDFSLAHTDRDPSLAKLLDWETIDWFAAQSMPGDWTADDPRHHRISPLHATDLAGLPPAVVITAGIDPFRSDGIAYGRALQAAGVTARHLDFPGQVHGFAGMDLAFPAGREALRRAAEVIADTAPISGKAGKPAPAEQIRWDRGAAQQRRQLADAAQRFPQVNGTHMLATLVHRHARSAAGVLTTLPHSSTRSNP